MKTTAAKRPAQDTLGIYLKEIRRIDLLTREAEQVLARRVKNGDRKALDELVYRNLRFVVSVAKQYARNGNQLEDLINEGNFGLIRAAEHFDVDRGFRFISYAVWWVRQAILQFLAEQTRTVRLPLNKSARLTKVNKASQQLSQHYGREPTADEIAKFLELKPREVEQVWEMPTVQFSIDEPASGAESDFKADTFQDSSTPGPEDTTVEHMLSEDVARVLSHLNSREEDILQRYYGLGGNRPHTLEEIGKVYKLTRERIRQIRDRAIQRIRESADGHLLAEYAG